MKRVSRTGTILLLGFFLTATSCAPHSGLQQFDADEQKRIDKVEELANTLATRANAAARKQQREVTFDDLVEVAPTIRGVVVVREGSVVVALKNFPEITQCVTVAAGKTILDC